MNLNNNLFAINVLIDRSGSMMSNRQAVVSGFNEFIKVYKLIDDKTVVLNLAFFDSGHDGLMRYQTVRHFTNVKEIKDLTLEDYLPNGGTPLVQAMCKSIDEFGEDLASMPAHERPCKVVMLVMTDGEENASAKEFTNSLLKSKVKTQSEVYNWQFVYIGANQDAFANSAKYGFAAQSTGNYKGTSGGTMYANAMAASSTMDYLVGSASAVNVATATKS
jgi:uncharacterized protein with von Willebrand factor type A (vWA) domain